MPCAILLPIPQKGVPDMKIWQWDDQKSITLTRYVVVLAMLGSAAATLGGPWLVRWLADTRPLHYTGPGVEAALLVLGYLCAALAFWMLYNLYRFLRRLEKGQVFVPQTVQALRRISWCCVGAGLVCLPAGIVIYLPFVFLTAAAWFMALIVRVLKDAFAQAVRMKNELDYTI